MIKLKVLFILKKRTEPYFSGDCGNDYGYTKSPGLKNSARLVSEMLNRNGIESKIVDVIDNNSIDKEVTLYKPTHVIIEALWVTPEKFDVLQKLHKNVKWIVRIHSKLAFLSNEGVAIGWLYKYLDYKNVYIAFNSHEMTNIFISLFANKKKILYLPNYYPATFDDRYWTQPKNTIKIGCFGAIRPLKNQLIQAIAAIEYAKKTNKNLEFHINSSRIEGFSAKGIIKNIRSVFSALDQNKFKLVEHSWLENEKFIDVLRKMDILLQVSYSETFNIVAADAVSNGIPIVVSKEISWAHPLYYADPNSVYEIMDKIDMSLFLKKLNRILSKLLDLNWIKLNTFSNTSRTQWLKTLDCKKIHCTCKKEDKEDKKSENKKKDEEKKEKIKKDKRRRNYKF